ncbi:unnamed protein product [Zymoseptoria tritici ST99CH_1A5]|nr:unnamed protein product [Zymoseptoria tritici ST99CH_1E4]SMR61576.1 unnamed protein product [Zymoseptoria tritici ST99CH_3D1]SMY27788.1 unnamed protein product [Zymoseptoria tritici ST99CH_1A5]
MAFRVLARRGDVWLTCPTLQARNPGGQMDMGSVPNHLQYRRIAGAWKSVFCDWNAALTRRDSFIGQGADDVVILALDLEYYCRPGHGSLEGVLNAYSFADVQNMPKLQFYGYPNGPLRGFAKEYLLPHGIPQGAVVACIPALGQLTDVGIHLGLLRVPGALVSEAGGTEAALKTWIREEVYSVTGVWNEQMVQRLMRAMCVEAWDYDLAL